MTGVVELLPGFPLTPQDYAPLLRVLRNRDKPLTPIRIAHSLGSLRALSEPSALPTILLAPSLPGRHARRSVSRAALALASRTPWSRSLAQQLRWASYRRYGAEPPPGDALTLGEATERLRLPPTTESLAITPVAVLASRDDARVADQRQLADRLGVSFHWVDGGHLFPITHPVETAAAIAAALAGGPRS